MEMARIWQDCLLQVIAVAKSSDIVLMVLDASKVSAYSVVTCICNYFAFLVADK